MALNPNKDLKQFYTISEVAQTLGINETTLRFWEKEFPQQIAPKKLARNVRHYTKDDLEKIRVVYNLVKVRGLKLSAARELLKKNRQGDTQQVEAVERLRALRAQLVAIKKEMGEL
ncbi:MAG: MerR family transcriptional regulator [Bacteroidaceae bacterium]|nr:MerR family transcriptional regulator [Bacteroidaceae bacterium]